MSGNIDLSVFGTVATIKASNTIPAPLPVTHFADDADGLDIAETAIGDAVMGVNGDMASWSIATPLELSVNVFPNTTSFLTMNTIYEANRVEKGKKNARDSITLVRIGSDGSTLTLSGGKMTSGTPGTSGSSSGRLKTASYKIKFAKMLFTPSPESAFNV